MRKKLIPLYLLASFGAYAQEILPETNILFGNTQTHGSARFQGMSGAMGAVGGDGSAASANPAGSGSFIYNHFSISGEWYNSKNQINYLENTSNSKDNNFHLPNVSAFFTHDTKKESGVTKVNYGFVYHTQKKYNNYTHASGTNNQSGVNYFLNHANFGYNNSSVPIQLVQTQNNETIENLYDYLNTQAYGFSAQQAMLAYQGYLINDIAGGGYESNMAIGNYRQDSEVSTSGHQSKMTANMALELNKKIYLGANLNFHFTDLNRTSIFTEENTNIINTGVKSYQFINNTLTYGNGFSFQLGAIAKATDNLRIGASYHSPSWHTLQDEFTQSLSSNYYDNGNLKSVIVNPNLTTLYDTYKVITPSSYTGSLAYIFGKNGLINIDYQYKDYSNTKYKENTGTFAELNNYYKRELQATHDIRIGGEYRINALSLRAGYRFVNSPYKTQDIIGDLNSVSAGIGYSYSTSRIDFAYTHAHQPIKNTPLSSGITQNENIKTKNNLFNITYSVSF